MTPPDDGLERFRTYVETRFNLLIESIKDASASQAGALGAAIEALKAALAAADLRYEQRFNAQTEALSAAFLNQQLAMKTALEAAKEAVLKAELAADKRFESLNELRQMVNDVVGTMMPKAEAHNRFEAISEKLDAINKRIDELNNRFERVSGISDGNRRTKDDTRLYIGLAATLVLLGLGIATFIYARFN